MHWGRSVRRGGHRADKLQLPLRVYPVYRDGQVSMSALGFDAVLDAGDRKVLVLAHRHHDHYFWRTLLVGVRRSKVRHDGVRHVPDSFCISCLPSGRLTHSPPPCRRRPDGLDADARRYGPGVRYRHGRARPDNGGRRDPKVALCLGLAAPEGRNARRARRCASGRKPQPFGVCFPRKDVGSYNERRRNIQGTYRFHRLDGYVRRKSNGAQRHRVRRVHDGRYGL
mmetsp:Transcript_23732/g.47643  ORF Transcript_23732/g.47643 Transcript_23732/m.47643 type:complete len:225 (+) Transcript_23732:406-1080(+)